MRLSSFRKAKLPGRILDNQVLLESLVQHSLDVDTKLRDNTIRERFRELVRMHLNGEGRVDQAAWGGDRQISLVHNLRSECMVTTST
jgi:hypothetical protein